MKIFLPGAGGKIGHIRNFQELPDVEKVIISDTNEWSYGHFVADKGYLLPPFASDDFFEKFYKLYEKEKFDVCIPIHDYSLYLFSKHRDDLAKLPFMLAINSKEVVDIVSDKIAIYKFFIANDVPTLKTYTVDEYLSGGKDNYPCFIKPRYIFLRGTAQQLFMKIEDDRDLEYALRKIKGSEQYFVLQEFVEGTEYNIDIFCDKSGTLKSVVALKRLSMGMNRGISRGEIVLEHPFGKYLSRITSGMRLYGTNQVQAYITGDSKLYFTEVNGRFSGSSVFVKEAGVNFFHYFIELIKGNEIIIKEQPKYLKMATREEHFYYTSSQSEIIQ
jgi:carbamoyl-phosphate synthase large subunit